MASKRGHNESPVTPSKKRDTGSRFMMSSTPGPPAGRHAPQVIRVIQGMSDLKNGPSLLEYPPLDMFWTVFGDHALTQFLKSSRDFGAVAESLIRGQQAMVERLRGPAR